MKKLKIAVFLGALSMLASSAYATQSVTLVNDPALSYTKVFSMDLNTLGIGAVSAQATYSSATVAAVTFDDGRRSTGSYLVVNTSALSSATASNFITVVSTTGLSRVALSVTGGYMLRQGVEWQVGATRNLTATNIKNALAKVLPFITFSNGNGVIYATAPAVGTAYNGFSFVSSSPTVLTVNTPTLVGGQDAAYLTINGVTLTAGISWDIVGSSSAIATSIAAAINNNATLGPLITATADSPTKGYVALVTRTRSAATNYAMSSSTATALLRNHPTMYGGVSSAYNKGSAVIEIASHGLTLGMPVLYTQDTAVISPLVDQTTYYAIPVTADTIALAASSAYAIAGTSITIVSSMAVPGYTYTLAPCSVTGQASFKWQGSNDNSTWTDLSQTSVTMHVNTSAASSWNMGAIGYRYLGLSFAALTTGGVDITVIVNGLTSASYLLKAGDTATGKLTAPDLTATYGLIAATATFTGIRTATITSTGNIEALNMGASGTLKVTGTSTLTGAIGTYAPITISTSAVGATSIRLLGAYTSAQLRALAANPGDIAVNITLPAVCLSSAIVAAQPGPWVLNLSTSTADIVNRVACW